MTNEEVVRRYAQAQVENDVRTMEALRHPEWVAEWPQSGEVVRGSDNNRAIMENYPGGAPRLTKQRRLVGSEDHWATSPVGGAYRIAGNGESWWGEWQMVYPDGRTWATIILLELRDGKIWRETEYWAEPFPAPAWRTQWVEKLEDS
jgi:ketosteroid isomerase-like protein